MKLFRATLSLSFAVAVAVLAGCTSDSPSEPNPGPANPIPPVPATAWSIQVTADPPEVSAGTTESSTITVQVRRADTGAAPPNLTQITLTTNLGQFGNPTSGLQTVTLQLTNGQAQAVLFPGDSEGTATVRAQLEQSAGFANVKIGEQETFFISSVTPAVGNPQGGETVTISGGGFEEPVRVNFGSATAQVLSVRANQIRVRTPPAAAAGADVGVGEAEQVNVSVTINVNENEQAVDSIPSGFTYAAGGGGAVQPLVFTVDPHEGSNEGGTNVVIVGQGFQEPVQVLFGQGASATTFNGVQADVQSVSPGRIVVTSPPARGFGADNVNQTVDILVRNVNSGFSTIARQQFKYGVDVQITAISNGSGPATGGTQVTVFGNGFDSPVAVTLAGIGQPVISVSGTEVVFRTAGVPVTSCPSTGIIEARGLTVTNIETGDSATNTGILFSYTVPRPQIFGLNPPGPGNVGSTTTISGENFAGNIQVLFGGANDGSSAQITARSPSSITVRVPTPPANFTFRTEACDANGDGIAGGTRPAETPISVTVRNLDSAGCIATLSNAFTLNPLSATCTGEEPIPPPPPQCSDGLDNDSDGTFDHSSVNGTNPDPQCSAPNDNSEGS